MWTAKTFGRTIGETVSQGDEWCLGLAGCRLIAGLGLAVDSSAGRQRRYPTLAQPARVAVDEAAVKIGGEWQWLYAVVDLEPLFLLDCTVFSHHSTDPAAAFLYRLTENYDLADTEFLVDACSYRTAPARLGLSGRVEHSDRNYIEKWFHTFKMRSDRFHTSWAGNRAAVTEWCQQFRRFTINSDPTRHSTEKRMRRW